ncbi:hypothetical protein ALNOE001_11250 [Candidatus Methanobinarius endosymbioticus]|uniref:Alpha/beta hydrolase n=1 Tax=Candidatus Methanobinarius endosymbioticus TaxID=2006182 RepID=A0A366MCA8_9EURY|nr:hypothetical protein ALNOE001_11250 [Candidatus Methanobinarius endosymbioticus]
MKILKDISYEDDSLQRLDIYDPKKVNGAVIIVIHGG